jgi:hypothetical protein
VAVVPIAPGLDEAGLLEALNTAYLALRCDWVYAVEAGEYLFPLPWGTNPRINGIGKITFPAPCFDGTPGVNRVMDGLSNICFDMNLCILDQLLYWIKVLR